MFAGGLVRILAALAVDMKQGLRLIVIGGEGVILQRPRGREAAGVLDLVEIPLAQSKERGSVHLRVAPDVVVQRRAEGVAAGVGPRLRGLISGVDKDGLGAPIRLFARQVAAPLQDQDALPRRREPMGDRGPAGAAADDDDIVMFGHPLVPVGWLIR